MSRFTNPVPQFGDLAADAIPGGQLFFYEVGTTTLKTTYSDEALTIPNTNPVILDGSGRAPDIFLSGQYKVKLLDAANVQIWQSDPVGTASAATALALWDTTRTYNKPDVVVGSDDLFYISLVDTNLAADPTISPGSWSQIKFKKVWNTNETYAVNDLVEASGLLYRSLTASNAGNTPSTSPTNWGVVSREFAVFDTYAAGRSYSKDDTVVSVNVLYQSLTDANVGNTPASSAANWKPLITVLTSIAPFGETHKAATTAIDVSEGNSQSFTAPSNTTFTFTTPPTATDFYSFIFELTSGSSWTITWPASVTWADGVAPTLTAKDAMIFWTRNNGTDWYGSYIGSIV